MIIADSDIGGARVRRVFSISGRHAKSGDELSADEVRAIPVANRRALVDAGYIEVWPMPRRADVSEMERHVVSRGAGKYDVIAGVKLNDELLSRDEAAALAGH